MQLDVTRQLAMDEGKQIFNFPLCLTHRLAKVLLRLLITLFQLRRANRYQTTASTSSMRLSTKVRCQACLRDEVLEPVLSL